MSSAMPNTFGMSLKISSTLHWNMSPAGAALNGSHLYQHWPNRHVKVVRYDNFSSNCKLWYPKLIYIIDIYCTLLSFGSISFNVGPL